MGFRRNFTTSRLGFSINLLDGSDRGNDLIDRHAKRPKFCGQFLMFIRRQAAILGHFDVLVAVVHGVGPAIEQLGDSLGFARRLNSVLRDTDFVLLDLVHGHGQLALLSSLKRVSRNNEGEPQQRHGSPTTPPRLMRLKIEVEARTCVRTGNLTGMFSNRRAISLIYFFHLQPNDFHKTHTYTHDDPSIIVFKRSQVHIRVHYLI